MKSVPQKQFHRVSLSIKKRRRFIAPFLVLSTLLLAEDIKAQSSTPPEPPPASDTAPSQAPEPQTAPGTGVELDTPEIAPTEPLPPEPALSPDLQTGEEPLPTDEPLLIEEDQLGPDRATILSDNQQRAVAQTDLARTSLLNTFGGLGSPLGSPLNTPITGLGHGIKLGALTIHPSVGAGVIGGNGTSIRGQGSGNDETGASGFGSINILARLDQPAYDRYIVFTYGLVGTFGSYNQRAGKSPINQSLTFASAFNFNKLSIAFNVNYAGLSGTNRDVGRYTTQKLANANLSVSYELTPKTSISSSLNAPIRSVSGGLSSGGLTSTNFLNYAVSPKLTVGPGFGAGFVSTQDSDFQTFEQALFNVEYVPTPFIAISGNAGYEFRQIEGTTEATPIFSVGITWTPRLGTSISLTGDRSIQNSATTSNTNYNQTELFLSVSQRVTRRINLFASAGYENAVYKSVGTNGEGGRVDNLIQGQIGISYLITSRWTASLSFSAGKNFSNDNPMNYQQATFQTTFAF